MPFTIWATSKAPSIFLGSARLRLGLLGCGDIFMVELKIVTAEQAGRIEQTVRVRAHDA